MARITRHTLETVLLVLGYVSVVYLMVAAGVWM